MADNSKYNGSTWGTGFTGILKTATETIQSGDTIYADGTAATIGLKGNEQHTGTPSPQNPVVINGVGERTENLYDGTLQQGTFVLQTGAESNNTHRVRTSFMSYPLPAGTYTIQAEGVAQVWLYYYSAASTSDFVKTPNAAWATLPYTFTTDGTYYVRAVFKKDREVDITIDDVSNVMINTGSTAKPYELYGYKIPILINSTTYTLYIGDNPLRKSLDGTAYDTLDSDGTLTQRVDSDGSVLATPVVSHITMPTFATVDGANTITVDTTVQPSEVSATWTGWHDSSVKEYDGTNWT